MSVPSFPIGRRGNSPRRRTSRCPIGVESMEGRALLTSAAVTSAIFTVQQAQLDLRLQVAQEVNTLKTNNLSIVDATDSFIHDKQVDILSQKQDELANPADTPADKAAIAEDELNIKNATRDEKFAIGQQNALIRQLGKVDNQINSMVASEINGLKKGKIDPANVPNDITSFTNVIQTSITTIDTEATIQLNGLTSTLASGTA